VKPEVILVGGGLPPADIMYGPLAEAIADRADLVFKDPEAVVGDQPPADYNLLSEAAGIERVADEVGFVDGFHLVGLSGGATAALVFASEQPQRLLSLTLAEPAWIGNDDCGAAEPAYRAEFDRLITLPPAEMLGGLASLLLAEGVEPPPPPEPPPPWVPRWIAGVKTAWPIWRRSSIDRDSFHSFEKPVYLPVGGLSARRFHEAAQVLADIFPDARIEVYERLQHFDLMPGEPQRLASALLDLWDRGESLTRERQS
jgi:pimeloyl-ACP methyl ester carboxylesterase